MPHFLETSLAAFLNGVYYYNTIKQNGQILSYCAMKTKQTYVSEAQTRKQFMRRSATFSKESSRPPDDPPKSSPPACALRRWLTARPERRSAERARSACREQNV